MLLQHIAAPCKSGDAGKKEQGQQTMKSMSALEKVMSFDLRQKIDPELFLKIQQNVENIFHPEIQTLLSADVQQALQKAVGYGVMPMFWASLLSSIVCLVFCIMLPSSD